MHKIKLALKLVNTKSQGDRVLINLAEDPNPNIVIEKQLDRNQPFLVSKFNHFQKN